MNAENDAPFIMYLSNLEGFLKNECISEGAFSTVHSVKVNLNDNLYCIKSFEFDCSDESKRKIFANNANKLFNINFPSLIPHHFFSLVDLDNQYHPSFIYPFYSNQSLKNNIKKLNDTHIMIIMIGISEGLRYLHQNNIAHGALEPSNILLDDQFRPVLTSYGLGKMITKFNSIDPQIPNRGSFNYMPPHNIYQQSDNIKNDIYSFALVVYYLLTKRDPYSECKKIIHIPLKIISGSLPKMPDTISSDFANFIYKCWSHLPQDRPTIQDFCKEVAKLRIPNIDLEQISQYKEYLKQEAEYPFNEFNRIPFNLAKKPEIVVQQYKAQLNEKGQIEQEKKMKRQKEREEQIRLQQEEERRKQQEEEQIRIQQEEEERRRQEQIRLQQEEEERIRIQQQEEDERRRQEQIRLQQEEEERIRIQQQEEEERRIKQQQEEEEEKIRIKQEKEKGDLILRQAFSFMPERQELSYDMHIDSDQQVQPPNDHQHQINDLDESLLASIDQQRQQQESEDKQDEILGSIFNNGFTTKDTLLPFIPNQDPVQFHADLPDDDYETENPNPPPLQEPDESYQTNQGMKTRRSSSRVRKTITNPFSETSSPEPSSSSSSPSEDDDSDVSFTSRKTKTKRSPSKTSPSKSQPITTRSSSRSTRSKSSSSNSKSRSSSSRKKNVTRKDKKKSDEDDEDYSSDIDIAMFQIMNDESLYNDSMKMNRNEDYSEDDDENNIKDVLSIQRPNKKKKRNNAKTDEDQFFGSLKLSNENKKLVRLAQSGDAGSLNELGIALIFGKDEIPSNPKLAFKFLDKAVKNQSDEAMINLGRCYEEGIGTPVDFKSAFELYQSAYETKEKYYAASKLGHCYEEGIGVQIDKKQAVYYYELCFSKGIDVSNFPRCLLFGIGIEANHQAAFELIDSSDEEDNNIIVLKGICYEYGYGVSPNTIKAMNCYESAVEKGNKIALVNLALLLLSMGISSSSKQKIPSNFQEISSFDYHVNNGENNLCFDESFISGSIENPYDPIDLLLEAANQYNLKEAKIHLADCYLRGVGVDVDLRLAIRNYSNASNFSDGIVRFNLYSTSPPSLKSINQIKSAAVEGQSDLALVIYGRLLQKGIATDYLFKSNGGPDDEALNLFKIASDNKSPVGMCQYGKTLLMMQRRAKLMSRSNEVVKNSNYIVDPEIEKEAISLIKKSAQMKYKGGLYNYGRCILESIGVIRVDNSNNNIIMIKNDHNHDKPIIQIKINFAFTTENDNDDFNEIDSSNIDLNSVREAYSYLRMAADLGNNNARVLLGRLMKHGTFLQIDEKGALIYFDLARRSGSKAGIYHYSRMVLNQNDSNSKETSSLLKELKGSILWEKTPVKSKAMNYYGRCLIFQTGGVRLDLKDVALYFMKASGYPFSESTIFEASSKACINYADCLMCGTGVEKDKNEAYKCYSQAIFLNQKEKYKMNHKSLYSYGSFLLKKDESRLGLDLIRISAEKGDTHALIKSAKFLLNGFSNVLVKDESEAFKIYMFLADMDNDVGLFMAGKMLVLGIGTQKNEELGKQMISKAAEKNNDEAILYMQNV